MLISVEGVVTLFMIQVLEFVFQNRCVKIFYLISGVNETFCLVQYELCECKRKLNESKCNS